MYQCTNVTSDKPHFNILPHFREVDPIRYKVCLGRAVDRCHWNDQDCAFKRIEFDCHIKAIDRERKNRENLLEILYLHCQVNEGAYKIMENRFNVIPVLAVAVWSRTSMTKLWAF